MKSITWKILKYSCAVISFSMVTACGGDQEGTVTAESKTSTAAGIDLNESLILDLTQKEQLGWISAERVEAISVIDLPQGAKKVLLSFSSKVNTDDVFITPISPWNLTQYPDHNVAFDVENLSDQSTQLYVGLKDSEGNTEQRSVSLPANYKGTVFFSHYWSRSSLRNGNVGRF